MGRKSIKPPDVDIEDLDQEDFHPSESVEGETRIKTMSKAGAARAALADGVVVPKEASIYIKRKFGIDISPQQFSAEKSRLKLRSGGFNPLSNQGPSGKGLDGYLAPPSKRSAPGEADLLMALEAMKPLIAQLGTEKVKRMVDLLG